VQQNQSVRIDAIANDSDPDGDALQFAFVAGHPVDTDDGKPDVFHRWYGMFEVFNPGDDSSEPDAAYIRFTPTIMFFGSHTIAYAVEDVAPNRVVNGVELDEPNPTHRARYDIATIRLQ